MKILLIKIILIFINYYCFASEELNIYSARQEVLMQPLIKAFEKDNNISINIISAKASQLINRIEQEGNLTKADILLTTDVGRLYIAKKKRFFQEINSPKLNNLIPKNFRDIDNNWFGLSLRARFIVYNLEKVSPSEFKGYLDLGNIKWSKRLLVRSSSNVYNQSLVSAMLMNYGEEKVKNFLPKFINNFARRPSGGDRDQIKAIISGQGDVAVVNSYYFLKMKSLDSDGKLNKIKEYYPEDNFMKTHINISGAGVINVSKNKDNAIKFLEFLVSDKAQEIYANVNFEYPIRRNIETNNFINKYNDFKRDELDLSSLAELNKKSIMLMDIAGWQ